jgi:hypothetical protein
MEKMIQPQPTRSPAPEFGAGDKTQGIIPALPWAASQLPTPSLLKSKFCENWLLPVTWGSEHMYSLGELHLPSRTWVWLSGLNRMQTHLHLCHIPLNNFLVYCFTDPSSWGQVSSAGLLEYPWSNPQFGRQTLPMHPHGDAGICRIRPISSYWVMSWASNVRAEKTEGPTCWAKWSHSPSCSQGVGLLCLSVTFITSPAYIILFWTPSLLIVVVLTTLPPTVTYVSG